MAWYLHSFVESVDMLDFCFKTARQKILHSCLTIEGATEQSLTFDLIRLKPKVVSAQSWGGVLSSLNFLPGFYLSWIFLFLSFFSSSFLNLSLTLLFKANSLEKLQTCGVLFDTFSWPRKTGGREGEKITPRWHLGWWVKYSTALLGKLCHRIIIH